MHFERSTLKEDPKPYPPLGKLKAFVKEKILKLAHINSEQTVILVEKYFAEG